MAYRFIGSFSSRRIQCEIPRTLSSLYCRCCNASGTKTGTSCFGRHCGPSQQDFARHLSLYNSSFSLHENKSSSYYKTNNLICDKVTLVNSAFPIRFFHISPHHYEKDKSVVEKAVEVMKDKKISEEKKTVAEEKVSMAVDKPKKSFMESIRKTAKYYKDGFVLFFKEIRISSAYIWKIIKGENLTRRELKQLVRTSADVFRMIPYLIMIVIPFFEFLIPVYVKLFPNALPSTFGRSEKKSDLVEQLKRKQEMGKFLQETLENTSLERSKKDGPSLVEEFSNFLSKVRSDGTMVSNEEILYFSKLFEDEITIDSLSRQQLQALCKVLSIKPWGTDHVLRFQLDLKLRRLKVDDKLIVKDGVDSLTVSELQQANRARGMRALGVDEQRLKMQLEQWLELHLTKKVPTSLLLLSRALYLPEELTPVEQLQKTIQSLPKAATDEATMKVAEISGEEIDPGTKIEVLKHEQEAIEKESKDKMEEQEKEKQEQTRKEEEKAEAIAARVAMETETLQDFSPEIATKAEEEIRGVSAEEELSAEDLKEIESVIENIAIERKFNIKEAELQDLKEDVDEYKEDLEDLRSVILSSGGEEEDIKESKSAKKLGKRVDKVVKQLDEKINKLHRERMDLNQEITVKEKTLIHAELSHVDEEMMKQKISETKGLVISINDMLLGLRRLQKVPDEVRLQKIVEVLDEDRDGIIDASHVLKVLKLIGHENIKLESGQVTELIDLCKKEMQIEEEEKQKEKEEKVQQKEKEEENVKQSPQ